MAGTTLEQAQAELERWRGTLAKLADAQAYSISGNSGGRSVTRVSADECQRQIKYWEKEVARLSRKQTSGGIQVRGGTPL